MIARVCSISKPSLGQFNKLFVRSLITTENLVEEKPEKKKKPGSGSFDSSSSSSLVPERPPHYDIVINGGGIVGLSLLLHIQRSPFLSSKSVLLIENQPDRQPLNLKELINQERRLSNRVSSLTLSSKQFLQNLDLWTDLEPFAKPTRSMHVWSNRYNQGVTFTPHRTSLVDNLIKDPSIKIPEEDYVCYVLENNLLLSGLRSSVDSRLIKFESKLERIEAIPGDTTVGLSLSDGSQCTASLLIGCDGFDSFVRKSSNIPYFDLDLDQSAIVGTVQVSKENDLDENDVAYQRFFLNQNWILALLPLSDNYSSFVLSVPRDKCPGLMEQSEETFVNTLNEALFMEGKKASNNSLVSLITSTADSLLEKILPEDRGQYIPRVNPPQVMSLEPQSRASFPLKFGTTSPWMVGTVKGGDQQKVIIIGDAAHRVHPLAGQGLNLGLGDAEILGQSLDEALSNGEELFGEYESSRESLNQVLFNVERKRQIKLIPMMVAIQTMQDLFTYLPSNVFATFNRLQLVKNEIVRFANSR